MTKYLVTCAILLAAAAPAATVHAGDRTAHACDFKLRARCASGDAKVTLDNGTVTRVEINIEFCALRGGPGYGCTIDSSRSDSDSKWSQNGTTVVIDNAAPFDPTHPDRVSVTPGPDIAIDLKNAQSIGRCGAGAELPQSIVIPAQGRTCRVRLAPP